MRATLLEKMTVPYLNLTEQHRQIESELLAAIQSVFRRGDFVLGEAVEQFERRFAAYCGTRYAIGVANGTDALILSLKALGIGPGDEVITVPNSFVATASAIALVGARPVFVDVGPDFMIDPSLIEQAITPATRAILPVHLTGKMAHMPRIAAIAKKHGLFIIEDAAQAVGAEIEGRRAGAWSQTGCFSLHPLKNLNACGDGGIIVTDDELLYVSLKQERNLGLRNRNECDFWAANSRLDTLQAAILMVKMDHLETWTEQRRENARYYNAHLSELVTTPAESSDERAVYHTYIIQCDQRDDLQAYLSQNGIDTKIHYPIPIHLQPAAKNLGYAPGSFPVAERQAKRILTLPVYPEMSMEQKAWVVHSIQEFYAS